MRWAVILLLLGVAPEASAQAPGDQTVARELFVSGVAAAREGRWEEARTAFERAQSLAPHPQILVNLGTAQVRTGRLVAAAESYREFLRTAQEADRAQHGETVERALQELEPRIPRFTLTVEDLSDGDRILLDGEPIAAAIVGVPYPVDPGAHVLVVEREAVAARTATFELSEGQLLEVNVAAAAPPPTLTETPVIVEPAPEPAPVWPWLLIGAGVLAAVGGGVAIGLLSQKDQEVYGGSSGVVFRGLASF